MRISRDQMLMEMAEVAAQRSTCLRKKIGAIIARDGRPISVGYGGAPAGAVHCLDAGCIIGPDGGCLRTQHAEANAVAFAASAGIATRGASLYTTISPCLSCAKIIVGAGIATVWYLEKYRDESGIDYLMESPIEVVRIVYDKKS
jgi:dCMP deaminase